MLFFQSYIIKTLRAALRKMGKLLLLRVKEVERTLRLSSATISGVISRRMKVMIQMGQIYLRKSTRIFLGVKGHFVTMLVGSVIRI
ncbi:hypothetical protein ACE198_02995 [Neobacillus sp. KR4-4]|uniref:hypothetical protein n=1 Tax=Neobacillus sp. KR4-4 TaxID=3344872 RepID=UPI0035C9D2CD